MYECPCCGTKYNSEEYGEDWYFVCIGLCGYRLVFSQVDGKLELDIVPEDWNE